MNGRIIKQLRKGFLKKFGKPANKQEMKIVKREYINSK